MKAYLRCRADEVDVSDQLADTATMNARRLCLCSECGRARGEVSWIDCLHHYVSQGSFEEWMLRPSEHDGEVNVSFTRHVLVVFYIFIGACPPGMADGVSPLTYCVV
mmetsp:Transcript_12770/g.35278  ORF Transcript_12770/g.35278 Transcript_12770/m.35278 type:complete len:107 (+) Transcript_12770:785-1105(+)